MNCSYTQCLQITWIMNRKNTRLLRISVKSLNVLISFWITYVNCSLLDNLNTYRYMVLQWFISPSVLLRISSGCQSSISYFHGEQKWFPWTKNRKIFDWVKLIISGSAPFFWESIHSRIVWVKVSLSNCQFCFSKEISQFHPTKKATCFVSFRSIFTYLTCITPIQTHPLLHDWQTCNN